MNDPTSYESLQRAPSVDQLRVLCDRIAPDAEIGSVRRLGGSMWCGMHAVDLHGANSERTRIVVRRYPARYVADNPDVPRREWEALNAVCCSEAPVPRPLLLDVEGSIFGVPTLIMTRLPGRALARQLAKVEAHETSWVEAVAPCLAQLHAVRFDATEVPHVPRFAPAALSDELLSVSSPYLEERLWELQRGEEVLDLLRRAWPRLPALPPVFLHGDFHPSNILWRGTGVTGVVDWAEARIGPREYDLAHMRWEIALRFDLAGVDRSLAAYEKAAGQLLPWMPLWDLMQIWLLAPALPSWVWFFQLEGRPDADLETIRSRRDAYLDRTLERASTLRG